MSVYTVKSVGESPREWSGHGKTFLSYKVDFEAEDGILERSVEWNKVSDSQAPSIGELVAGSMEEGKFGPKFKIDYETTKELHQGGSRASSSEYNAKSELKAQAKSWQPEHERDPQRAARILRQHSQEMALRFLALTDTPINNASEIFEYADLFDQDVLEAGQGASRTQGSPPAEAAAAHPPGGSPGSDLPPADELQELHEALDTAGLLYPPAKEMVASFMASELPPDRIKKAVGNLVGQDTTLQGETLKALRAQTERFTGKLIPEPSDEANPDDSIPFRRPPYRSLFTERERWRF